jgi:Spy/CpxP family protein refolding chaperone
MERKMKKLIAAVVLLSASTAAFAAAPKAAHAPCHGSCPHCHHHRG